jgi:hypothetical protein
MRAVHKPSKHNFREVLIKKRYQQNLQTTKQKHIWHNRTDVLVHKLPTLVKLATRLGNKVPNSRRDSLFCSCSMQKCSVSLSKDEKGNFLTTFGRFVKEYEILGRTVTAHETTDLHCDYERENQNQKWKGATFLTLETAHMFISKLLKSAITTSKGISTKTRPSKPVTAKKVQVCHTCPAFRPLVINFQIYSNNNNTK